jgi:hypothetical protein
MTPTVTAAGIAERKKSRYRLPGIEREGIAQLSLLETALWPLKGGELPQSKFELDYTFPTSTVRKLAHVTVRAPSGLQPKDELVLWGLLGATLVRQDPEPVLLATPHWMLRHLGLDIGGSQYAQLQESLLRLALASYQNTGFYNPETKEHEFVAFQFLSMFLPTVGGVGETVDNDRCWRIEWNAPFFRFCKATGGNLLFDLDLYRALTPAARRLFLKLKDRFWRMKRAFMNVDDLTVNGLGFSTTRPLYKRKFDLTACMKELLDLGVIELGRGQRDVNDLFIKKGEASYVVLFHQGPYFRREAPTLTLRQPATIADDPLIEPLRKIGVDGPAIRRILATHPRSLIQRWIDITDAALHEKPRDFPGFRVSAAAFLIDGVQHRRTPPDWMYAHEKRRQSDQWRREGSGSAQGEQLLRERYMKDRADALRSYVASTDGRTKYDQYLSSFIPLHRVTDPHQAEQKAREAALARIERLDFQFPEYPTWVLRHGG